MPLKLYELADNYNALIASLDNDEVQQEELLSLIGNIEEQFKDKAIATGKVIRSLLAETDGIQSEINRLASRQQSLQNKTEWLKKYLMQEMINSNIDKIKGDVLNISLKTNPPSVQIINQEDIPPEYRRVIPETWQPDKAKILTQFKDTGEIIPGIDIVRDKKSLSIR